MKHIVALLSGGLLLIAVSGISGHAFAADGIAKMPPRIVAQALPNKGKPKKPRPVVPEIDIGVAGSGIALLAGMIVLLTERRRSSEPSRCRVSDASV
jgi:hypothetical protein